eukprot:SM000298S10943  [mRNA]  locus=s298:9095:16342:+ [translate_table: standard]
MGRGWRGTTLTAREEGRQRSEAAVRLPGVQRRLPKLAAKEQPTACAAATLPGATGTACQGCSPNGRRVGMIWLLATEAAAEAQMAAAVHRKSGRGVEQHGRQQHTDSHQALGPGNPSVWVLAQCPQLEDKGRQRREGPVVRGRRGPAMEAGGQPAAGQGSTPRPLPLMLGARYHSSVAAAFRAACLLIPTRAAVLEDQGASMPPAALRFEQLQVAQQHLLHLLFHHLPREPSASTLPPLVGLHLPPSAAYLVALLAALEAGAAFVPLDPSLPSGRLHAIAADAQLAVIVTQDATVWSSWQPAPPDAPALQQPGNIVGQDSSAPQEGACKASPSSMLELPEAFVSLAWESRGQTPDAAKRQTAPSVGPFCYVLYTSGSTGLPKGVCGTELGLLNRLAWMEGAFPFDVADLCCFKTRPSFIDHLTEVLGPLLAGVPVLIPPDSGRPSSLLASIQVCLSTARPDERHLTLEGLGILLSIGPRRSCQRHGVSRLVATPTLLSMLLQDMKAVPSTVNRLRLIMSSGEQLPYSLVEELQTMLPHAKVVNLMDSALSYVPIGVPISGCKLHILLPSSTMVVQQGEEGELCVSGTALCWGYLHRAELTDHHFQLSEEQERLFRTRDLARELDKGVVRVTGRLDRQVKVAGQRVNLAEVEAVLTKHPAVQQAAVCSWLTPSGLPWLVAYLVPQPSHISKGTDGGGSTSTNNTKDALESELAEIRQWLFKQLPQAMHPKEMHVLQALPLSASGKLDYAALVSPQWPIASRRHAMTGRYEEAHVLKVLAAILGLPTVTPAMHFFQDGGGNSMTAALAAHELGIQMDWLYQFPYPRDLILKVQMLEDTRRRPHRREIPKRLRSAYLVPSSSYDDALLQSAHQAQPQVDGDSPLAHQDQQSPLQGPSDAATEGLDHRLLLTGGRSEAAVVALTKCNRITWLHQSDSSRACPDSNTHVDLKLTLSDDVPGEVQVVWRLFLGACIDASPVLVYHHLGWRILVGSHAHIFMCASASSGRVQWQTQLGGRIEAPAAVTLDGTQVKCQPLVDPWAGSIWCGSHDKHVYVLRQPPQASCMWRHKCPGSIFASPALDEVRRLVYVATTSGHVLALAGEEPFHVRWSYEAHSPIFGVPAVDKDSGLVVFGAVNGSMTGISSGGAPLWKASAHCEAGQVEARGHYHSCLSVEFTAGGPIFAGLCTSLALPGQVLASSRDGYMYCLSLFGGKLLWRRDCGAAMTASPCVDAVHDLLAKGSSRTLPATQYVCGCSTAGDVRVFVAPTATGSAPSSKLRGRPHATAVEQQSQPAAALVYKMPGEVFSSPVMLGGHIYVGCRDDYLYCLELRPGGPAEAA